MNDELEIQIAVSVMRGKISTEGPLPDRLLASMRFIRKNERNVLWMSPRPTDSLRMRCAIAAVLVDATADDCDLVRRSIAPLAALSAAMEGVPVDLSQLELTDDLIPLLKLWHESAT